MEIHVARNGEKFGPYSPDVVRTWLAAGKLNINDMVWYNGLAQWVPLGTVLAGLPRGSVPPPPAPLASVAPAKSGLARASFFIGIVTSCVWVLILACIIAFPEEQHEGVFMACLILLLNLMANLAGGILGLIAVFKPSSNRWIAIVGVSINSIEFLGIVMLMVIGLAHRHAQFQY